MGLLLAAALVPPLLSGSPCAGADGVRLELRPRAGAVVAVDLDQTNLTRVSHEEGWPLVDGQRVEGEGWASDGPVMDTAFELALAWEDRYGAVDGDGRVLALDRHFVELGGSSVLTDAQGDLIEEGELGSPLAGRTVRFRWDGEAGAYACSFAAPAAEGPLDGAAPEAEAVLLEDQRIDTGGGWFLPPVGAGELVPGDGWDLDPTAWNDFLTMGGDWWIGPGDAPAPDREQAEANRTFERQLRESAEGRVRCVLGGVREEGGRRWAEVGLEVALETRAALDLTDEYPETRTEVSVEVRTGVKAEGTLLWDVEGGRPASLDVRIELATRTREVSTAPRADCPDKGTSGTEIVTVEETVTDVAVRFTHRDG